MQRCMGIGNSDIVVNVNKDPKAPFVGRVDYSVVGTLEEVIPELMKTLG